MSAISDRMTAEDFRAIARILRRVRQRIAAAEDAERRERAEAEGRRTGEGGEHDAA